MSDLAKTVEIRNKRASFEFQFLDIYTAGIALRGTEIKSIRQQKVNLQDAYCYINEQGVFIKNMHISVYDKGTYLNHEPLRERRLLLQKKEINKLTKKLDDQGMSLIPIKLFITDRGFAKMEIALAKGKKLFDKREDMKEKDAKRELDRMKF